jgi:hypothetical protein
MCLVLFTGHVLIEISSTHKQLNESLDENVRDGLHLQNVFASLFKFICLRPRSGVNFVLFCEQFRKFHKEVIHELEKKTELDVKYMTVSAAFLPLPESSRWLLSRNNRGWDLVPTRGTVRSPWMEALLPPLGVCIRKHKSQAWLCMPVIPALRRLRRRITSSRQAWAT